MGIDTKSTLHGKAETEVFQLLIDAYRMRCQDESAYSTSMPKNSLYDGGDPIVGFKEFLDKAQVSSLLVCLASDIEMPPSIAVVGLSFWRYMALPVSESLLTLECRRAEGSCHRGGVRRRPVLV